MKTISFTVLSCLFALQAFAQVSGRDNPTQLPTPEEGATTETPVDTSTTPTLDSLMAPELASMLQEGEVGKAYLLEEWVSDTTDGGLLGFKVAQCVDTLNTAQCAAITQTLSNPAIYDTSDAQKRCEFAPRLGFELRYQGALYHVLVATNCDLLKIYAPDGLVVFTEDVDDGHDDLTTLGNKIFPGSLTTGQLTNSNNH